MLNFLTENTRLEMPGSSYKAVLVFIAAGLSSISGVAGSIDCSSFCTSDLCFGCIQNCWSSEHKEGCAACWEVTFDTEGLNYDWLSGTRTLFFGFFLFLACKSRCVRLCDNNTKLHFVPNFFSLHLFRLRLHVGPRRCFQLQDLQNASSDLCH